MNKTYTYFTQHPIHGAWLYIMSSKADGAQCLYAGILTADEALRLRKAGVPEQPHED